MPWLPLGPMEASAGVHRKGRQRVGIYNSCPAPRAYPGLAVVWLLPGDCLCLQAWVVTTLGISPGEPHCSLWLPDTLPVLCKYPLHSALQSSNLFSCKDSDTSSKEVLNWVLGVLKESKKVLTDICHFFCTFLKPSLSHTHIPRPSPKHLS